MLSALLGLVFCVPFASAVLGPIATDRPHPAGGDVQCSDPPLASFFTGHSPPYPTDDWWSGYGVAPGNAIVAGPFPYESNLANGGISFGVSTSRQWDGVSIKQPTQTDWTVGFKEHSQNFNDHKALSWDRQSVQVQYFTGASSMTGYMVPGSPYLTFKYASATPQLTSGNGAITSLNGNAVPSSGSVSATGTEFTVVNNVGSYLIYALNGAVTLSGTAQTLTASSAYNGVLRVAKLNSTSHKALLDQYSANYPTAVTTDYSFSGDSATLTFTWAVTGNTNNLLMLSWPHHRAVLQGANQPSTSSLSYLTTKGWMYPVIGNVWNMHYSLSTINWNPPRAADSSCQSAIIQGLQYEIGKLSASSPSVPGDFYYWGGAIAAQGRLALIADHMGQSSLINQVVQYMEASYAYWFKSGNPTLPGYETTWGGIVDAAGATNVNIDFGNGFYNDHHFHYGYFLTGAAIIAKYDSNWLNTYKTQVNWFLRDIANPSPNDPYFPVTRHRDWFAGHSWASGIANGAGSRDQESSGEAINGYYGAMLWSLVTGNTDMYNYARLLLATEQQAVKTYWHLYPSMSSTDPTNPYPESYVRSLITMGNVEDWQSGAWLFWGSQKSEIAAIQILPVTPIGEYTYDSAWVQNVYQYTLSELNDPTVGDEWKCVIYDAYANANPQQAAQLSTNLQDWGTGNTYTNTLHFIATRNNPSGTPICSGAPANPTGSFKIQSTTNNNYVVASTSSLNLAATTSDASQATVFKFTWLPNSGNILDVATNQYVTADQSGSDPLQAARTVASTWEEFMIRQKVGAASGVYSIKAGSNSLYVTVRSSDGALVNGGANEAASTGFRLVAA